MMKTYWLSLTMLSLLLIVNLSCGGGEEPAPVAEEAAPAAVWKPTGNEGTITGKINFTGQAPTFRPLNMNADAVCAAKHSRPVYPEVVVVNDNVTLRNVLVHVTSGLEGKTFEVPSDPVVLDQDGCIYKPHVLGMQAQQPLKITTQDNTTHNVHPLPKVNREWNESQAPGVVLEKTFARPEVMIPVKCNQHPWMRAYIGVLSHPFHAVSGEDGTFQIKGLPPGEYQIEAWHEQYEAQTMNVSVEPNGTATVEFTFGPDQASHPGSLRMMPALVLP